MLLGLTVRSPLIHMNASFVYKSLNNNWCAVPVVFADRTDRFLESISRRVLCCIFPIVRALYAASAKFCTTMKSNSSKRPSRSYFVKTASSWRTTPAIKIPRPTAETSPRARLQINKSVPVTRIPNPNRFIPTDHVMIVDLPFCFVTASLKPPHPPKRRG
jgi:hypothetical protein